MAPLNRRSWVVQERIMSPRNLHFGARQLFWECKELAASELFPQGFPVDRHFDTKEKAHNGLKKAHEPDLRDRLAAMTTWDMLVGRYTSSRLTYECDKLVAIASLAAQWGKATKFKHVAGLWMERLPQDLLWRLRKPVSDHANRQYTAPSWSWAAVDGEVTGRTFALSENCVFWAEIIDLRVEYVDENSYGQFKGGILTLNVCLAPIKYRPRASIASGLQDRRPMILITSAEESNERDENLRVFWDTPRPTVEDANTIEEKLYLMPILVVVPSREEVMNGLVLRAKGNSLTNFSRVGMFYLIKKDSLDSVWKSCEYFNSIAGNSGTACYKDAKGELRYTINIT